MGEVSINSSGWQPKISLLFNNPKFSDVEFVFTSDTGQSQRIYGHKLILALRSKKFAYKFFEKREPTPVMLPASKRTYYERLLRFLYTDHIEFHSFEEAQGIYDLSNAYEIEELSERCYKYMLEDRLTLNNIFSKYECALSKNIGRLLKDCRDFVCTQAHLVLRSKNFTAASPQVVEDIIRQENLSVSSELDIITAVVNWGKEDLKRKQIPCDEIALRNSISQFKKYLRFLTLSSSEFDHLIEHYNILSAKESSVLTRKIMQPHSDVIIPKDICSLTTKRRSKDVSITYSDFDKFCIDYKHSEDSSKSVLSDFSKSSVYDSPKYTASSSLKSQEISFEVKKGSTFREQKAQTSQIKQTKFRSTPNVSISGYSSPTFVPRGPQREYSFPLSSVETCFELSFKRDVTSSVSFQMHRGNIALHGFELRIKNEEWMNELEVFVHVNGFSDSDKTFSQFCTKQISNNIFTYMFPEPMTLREGKRGKLEVTIDNLRLSRCGVCHNVGSEPYYELNNGLNFVVGLSLKSNQTLKGFIFLIDKLLYTIF